MKKKIEKRRKTEDMIGSNKYEARAQIKRWFIFVSHFSTFCTFPSCSSHGTTVDHLRQIRFSRLLLRQIVLCQKKIKKFIKLSSLFTFHTMKAWSIVSCIVRKEPDKCSAIHAIDAFCRVLIPPSPSAVCVRWGSDQAYKRIERENCSESLAA